MDPVVAAFDVDGTLTVRDCVFPFMWRCGGARGAARSLFSSPVSLVRMVVRRDRDGLKAHFIRCFMAGLETDVVERKGEEFADVVAREWMRPDVAQRLRWHQDQGHVVVLVSASLAPYLEPLGELLEVDAVLCTRLQSVDGVLTGEIDGANCRADEKVSRLVAWASGAGITGGAWLGYAYGDSSGDTAMLALAQESVNVARREVSV